MTNFLLIWTLISIAVGGMTADKFIPVPPDIAAVLDSLAKPSVNAHPINATKNFNLLDDPSLTNLQRGYILRKLLGSNNVKLAAIPPNLLSAMPSNQIMDIPDDSKTVLLEMARRFDSLVPSQKLALYLKKMTFRVKGFAMAHLRSTSITQLMDDYAEVPESLAKLMAFVSPSDFKANLRQFERVALAGRSVETRMRVASHLPQSLLRAWFEIRRRSSDEDPSLLALRCSDLSSYPTIDNLRQVTSDYNALRRRWPVLTPFPRALQRCLRQRLTAHLEARKNKPEKKDMAIMDMLTTDEIKDFGGNVLAAFDLKEMGDMRNETLSSAVLRSIGAMSPADMMMAMSRSKVESVAKLAIAGRKVFSFDDLTRLGSFLFVSSSSGEGGVVSRTTEEEDVVDYVRNVTILSRVACMTRSAMLDWNRALVRAYGPVSTWSSLNITFMGDLLLALDDAQLAEIRPASLFYAQPILLKRSQLNQHVSTGDPRRIAEVCHDWLQEDGPHFAAAHDRLMRLLLRTAQLRADMLEDDQNKPYPSDRPAYKDRVRRQIKDTEPTDLTFKRKIQSLLVRRSMDLTRVIELELAMTELLQSVRAEASRLLGLDAPPSKGQTLQSLINVMVNAGDISAAVAERVSTLMNEAQGKANRVVAKLMGLTHLDLGMSRSDFCDYMGDDACAEPGYEWLVRKSASGSEAGSATTGRKMKDALDGKVVLPRAVRCSGLKLAGSAARAVYAEEMRGWSRAELEECLETLGGVEWPLERKREVWKLLKEKEVVQLQSGKIPVDRMLALDRLLEAAAHDDIDVLSLSLVNARDWEGLSVLGQMAFPEELLRDLAAQTAADSSVQLPVGMAEIDVMMFGATGTVMCGFNDTELINLVGSERTAKFLLPMLGSSLGDCPNQEALGIFAKAAKTVYGEPRTWHPSSILGLGSVVSGLTPADLASLDDACLAALPAAAVARLTSQQLSVLTTEQAGLLEKKGLLSFATSVPVVHAEEDGLEREGKHEVKVEVVKKEEGEEGVKEEKHRRMRLLCGLIPECAEVCAALPDVCYWM